MSKSTRVIFTQGGKGGVAKTEVTLSLISWYREQGLSPALLDFDIENTNRSGLQNFYPEATKLDVHKDGTLDEFFDVCDQAETGLVVADLGAGAGEATYRWFDEAFEDASEARIHFTSIGVTTNEAGAVQSVLKWGKHLQDQVNYLIVLNEMREPGCDFEYWKSEPAVERFLKAFSPEVMVMHSRIVEFQSELRNHAATLQQVIDGKVDTPFFLKSKNRYRAKRYQRNMFTGFDRASKILLPPS
ncbi:MAG: MinD-like ATPase involved in chromosome partitioning or flagellar assembly [Akkermansiaceae bacterium]|jgi:MinD-like ATPase involved in chromosome partitioning or flagellar assembly